MLVFRMLILYKYSFSYFNFTVKKLKYGDGSVKTITSKYILISTGLSIFFLVYSLSKRAFIPREP